MQRTLIVAVIILAALHAAAARAADDPAERDPNRVPAMLGINAATETRNIRVNDAGYLQVDTVTTVAEVASGTFKILDSGGTHLATVDASGRLYVDGVIAFSATPTVFIDDNGGSITVDSASFDIRQLTAASDTVTIEDGGGSITVDGAVTVSAAALDIRQLTSASDTVTVEDGGSSLTVDAASLDIRQLTAASDTVTIEDGGGTITVDGSVTVSATALDTRPLTAASDTVSIDDTLDTFEYDHQSVASSATHTFTFAADVNVICVFNNGADHVSVVLDPDIHGVASLTNGLPVPTKSGKCWEKIVADKISVYNFDAAAAAGVFVEGRR